MSRRKFSRHDLVDILKEIEKTQKLLVDYRYIDAMDHLKAVNKFVRWLIKYRRF